MDEEKEPIVEEEKVTEEVPAVEEETTSKPEEKKVEKVEAKEMSTEEKIVKYAKDFKIFSKVLYIMSCVATLVFVILAIVLPLTCKFSKYSKVEVALVFVGLALYAFFLIGVLWNVEQIFVSIEKEKSPFSANVTKYIRKVGIFIILTSVIPALVQGLFLAIFAKDSDVNSAVEVGGIIAGIVCYLLGYFFKYGEELKNKDDETL